MVTTDPLSTDAPENSQTFLFVEVAMAVVNGANELIDAIACENVTRNDVIGVPFRLGKATVHATCTGFIDEALEMPRLSMENVRYIVESFADHAPNANPDVSTPWFKSIEYEGAMGFV